MYLDCYHSGAILGETFPVNSYGPATLKELKVLESFIGHNFTRVRFVEETKGQNPLPKERWPLLLET